MTVVSNMPSTTDRVRVLIVDEELLFGRALAYVLADDPHISVVGVVPGRHAVLAPAVDVVVIDIDSDDVGAIVEAFKQQTSTTKICALSSHTEGELMQHCLALGVDAYIVKDSSLQELRAAIKALGAGSSYVDPRVAASLLRRRGPSTERGKNELSPREIEVVQLLARGLSNRQIGQQLVLAEKTIKNHVSNVFAKLHCSTRSQAAVYAVRHGLANGIPLG
jgi:DNA-binding NarL/FixJ family response regulator